METSSSSDLPPGAIAIVGMACRFPGANNIDEFWNLLQNGEEAVRLLSEKELDAAGVSARERLAPDYIRMGAPIDDMEGFDAGFFGFSPRDAAIMDPQHRHFLECSWEALEHAGYNPYTYEGAIGVFAGCGMQTYFTRNLANNRQLMNNPGLFLVRHTGNDKDFFATRVSYQFDLHGPAMSVQTACSTSLVAVHLACQSLLSGESDMAMAGGATIVLPHRTGYTYKEGEILAQDGHCRPFDASSTGTVFGSGIGVVVLRRLEDSVRDGDEIHAVILGSAVNNDGAGKVSYLAPSVEGQAAAVAEALEVSGVEASSVTYVETHGTGTQIGDPIEVTALTQAYRQTTSNVGYCGLGSVKSNIGHLDAAAGIAGLMKAALALKHRQLPATLHFKEINPRIPIESSPFYVVGERRPWTLPVDIPIRRAGVNSLGVGGTNAHVILEEAPQLAASEPSRGGEVLVFSAQSESSLNRITERMLQFLKGNLDVNLSDMAYTLQLGRHSFGNRRIVAVENITDAIEVLEKGDPVRIHSGLVEEDKREVVFMFPGQGIQYVNMGRDLYDGEPVFRDAMDLGFQLLWKNWNIDLRSTIYPEPDQKEEAEAELKKPGPTNLSIFLVEYSLAKLWLSFGIQPAAMIGHSLGEYVLACIGGIMSFEDAISLVVARSRIFERMPRGLMLAVPLGEEEVQGYLHRGISVAALNAASLTVVSGTAADIEELKNELSQKEIESQVLKIPVAAHSTLLDPFLEEFRREAEKISYQAPTIPCVSNLIGGFVAQEVWMKPEYWVDHLRNAVRFSDGYQALAKEHPDAVMIEVGPAHNLCTLGHLNVPNIPTVPSMRKPNDKADDRIVFLSAVGRIWNAGFDVNWTKIHREKRRRVALPTYAFEHQRFWIEESSIATGVDLPSEELKRANSVQECFSRIAWVEDSMPSQGKIDANTFVIITGDPRNAEVLEDGIRSSLDRSVKVLKVTAAKSREARKEGGNHYDFLSDQDCRRLIAELVELHDSQVCLVYDLKLPEYTNTNIEELVEYSFHSLVKLLQAIAFEELTAVWDLRIVVEGGFSIAGECNPNPLVTLVVGACRVACREIKSLHCKVIDTDGFNWSESATRRKNVLIEEIVRTDNGEREVCLRDGRRWKAESRVDFHSRKEVAVPLLRTKGVYLITGGTGGLGLELAHYLSRTRDAKIVLVSRKKNEVEGVSETGGVSRMIHIQADVGDRNSLENAIAIAEERFGRINGIFHCAGIVEDALLVTKSRESLDRVLRSKVVGSANLVDLFAERKPDFLVFFSSVSGWLGTEGQIDYAASSLFLDALAQNADSTNPFRVSSIAWGPWKEVGMAVRMLEADGKSVQSIEKDRHPLLQGKEIRGDTIMYTIELDAKDTWILDGHRTKSGTSLLPGTAYLEMARKAAGDGLDSAVKLTDIVFLSPLVVEGLTEILLEYERASGDFVIRSRAVLESGKSGWVEHCSGKAVKSIKTGQPDAVEIEEEIKLCSKRHHLFHRGESVTRQEEMLRFGERWFVLEEAWYGTNCSVGRLRLPDEFIGDLDTTPLHPAVLDIATGFALPIVEGYEDSGSYYVPVSYREVKVHKILSPVVYSVVRCKDPSNRDSVVFDVQIVDEQGRVLVTVLGFRMMRLGTQGLELHQDRSTASLSMRKPEAEWNSTHFISNGLLTSEGMEALELHLNENMPPAITVSPFDPGIWKKHMDRLVEQSFLLETEESEDQAALLHPRPHLSNGYTAPQSEVEQKIAEIWKVSLGISEVGVDDNFYELGGHSLALVQILIRVRKSLDLDIPVGDPDLFENPTIKAMAKFANKRDVKAVDQKPTSIRRLSRQEFQISRAELNQSFLVNS